MGKLLASGFLVIIAALVYAISAQALEYRTYLEGFSFALLLLSLAAVVYDLRSPTRLVPPLAVFLMVSLPASLMDSAVLALSKFAATANPRLSAVETAYASTVVLNAALSVTSAALLSISLGRASWRRRAVALTVSIAIVLAVGSLVGIAGG